MICRDSTTHGWVCWWIGGSVGQWVGSGHITKYQINLDLIEIIQFCLNIYDLLHILDIFLDILLKPPQPLMGLFFDALWSSDLPISTTPVLWLPAVKDKMTQRRQNMLIESFSNEIVILCSKMPLFGFYSVHKTTLYFMEVIFGYLLK